MSESIGSKIDRTCIAFLNERFHTDIFSAYIVLDMILVPMATPICNPGCANIEVSCGHVAYEKTRLHCIKRALKALGRFGNLWNHLYSFLDSFYEYICVKLCTNRKRSLSILPACMFSNSFLFRNADNYQSHLCHLCFDHCVHFAYMASMASIQMEKLMTLCRRSICASYWRKSTSLFCCGLDAFNQFKQIYLQSIWYKYINWNFEYLFKCSSNMKLVNYWLF